jgi:hypothetical protein
MLRHACGNKPAKVGSGARSLQSLYTALAPDRFTVSGGIEAII